ncbi:MAG: DUF5611 family protein [Candidatus Thermoplasmatota archaeon]|jgi:hypothetical protein|nr:DUF5611 family protein [Candidatus Thermoplasmatota archaeon]MCL5988131.1 DUF5611 family protein [Candidatus Thermoplasmatota archaeon]
MREYPVRKGLKTDTEPVLSLCLKYSKDSRIEGNSVVLTLPGLKTVKVICGMKNLQLETESDPSYGNPQESIKVYNEFITELTGFDSKERKKRLSKV